MSQPSPYAYHQHAVRLLGRALFGSEYLERLSARDSWLVDEHGLIYDEIRTVDDEAGSATPARGPSRYNSQPRLSPEALDRVRMLDLEEFASAWRNLRFMEWQEQAIIQWLEDHGIHLLDFSELVLNASRTKFEECFAKSFPLLKDKLHDQERPSAAEPTGSHAGRPRVYDWDGAYRYIIGIANSLDGLPSKQADLIELVAQWFQDNFQKEPVKSVIQERVSAIYKIAQKAGN